MEDKTLTIEQIKAANKCAGQHFFDPSSMRFFASRVGRKVYPGNVFITSEQFVGSDGVAGARKYSVRRLLPDGRIATLSAFQEYGSCAQAHRAAAQLSAQHVAGEGAGARAGKDL